MTEWKLWHGDGPPHVSTFEFHEHRPRAPHLEQATHRERLVRAAALCLTAGETKEFTRVVDLGCGDGGLLQLLKPYASIGARGYDFQPSNEDGWAEREVRAYALNFVDEWDRVANADVYVITEVLEHLADPHGMVRRIRERNADIVCSSPWTETYESHDECHAWAWDQEGYATMISGAGFNIRVRNITSMFQIIWATPKE